MIVIVDRCDAAIVQKIISPKGNTIRYQVVREPGNYESVTVCSTLAAARAAIGKTVGGKIQVAQDKPILKLGKVGLLV